MFLKSLMYLNVRVTARQQVFKYRLDVYACGEERQHQRKQEVNSGHGHTVSDAELNEVLKLGIRKVFHSVALRIAALFTRPVLTGPSFPGL